MFSTKLPALAISASVILLSACGTTGSSPYPTTTYPSASSSSTTGNANVVAGYGVVQSIDMVPRENSGIGLGTAAGAIVGGIIGHQIGSGSGNTAATVAGAAGGALAGRALENNRQGSSQVYRITLRMDNGTVQSLVQESLPSLRVGDRIRINNGVIERM